MYLSNDWDAILEEKQRDRAREQRRLAILAQLPPRPAWWRVVVGRGMRWVGVWLTVYGERLLPDARPAAVPAKALLTAVDVD
jgi:hypothetical protein